MPPGADGEARGAAHAAALAAPRSVAGGRLPEIAGSPCRRAARGRRRRRAPRRARAHPRPGCAPTRHARARPGGRACRRSSRRRGRASPRCAISRSTARGSSCGPSASTTSAASTSSPSAARPQRRLAPGPSAQSGQATTRTPSSDERLSSGCAPSTTTTSPTDGRGEALEHVGKEDELLGRAVAGGRTGREDDGGDHGSGLADGRLLDRDHLRSAARRRRRACRSRRPRRSPR